MARYYSREHFEACQADPEAVSLRDRLLWNYTPTEEEPMEPNELSHVCPICGSSHIKTDWQTTDDDCRHWFTGHYVCLSCLTAYHASGAIRSNGYPAIHAWNPACPRHGTEPVVLSLTDKEQYYCYKCGRKLQVRNGKVVVTWQPPSRPAHQPAMEAAHA